VALTSAVLARGTVSRTFEGRDRFAPAAAWLAIGTDLARFGPPAGALVPTPIPDPRSVADGVDGEVVRVDRFGNLVTNIPDAALLSLGPAVTIHAGDADIAGLVGTYAEAAPGALCAMTGSTGRLEVALNGGSAAAVLGGARGLVVRIRRRVGA
jgi:S-adenosylmethionine hydrolase